METVINLGGLAAAAHAFGQQAPFDHAIIEDVFSKDFAGRRRTAGRTARAAHPPSGERRKSLAMYYPCDARAGVDARGKALFTPTGDQKSDEAVLELDRRRSNAGAAPSAYMWSWLLTAP